ncbi:gluconate 2-dehydrogenase subunit 3 family protein [Lentibacillus halophilus]|uniref:Gluconate 2-dehydrogenase subunit 3 family protein n=1 Tax=Lentibacillus halophilus TaxID=295065 RepID=A0ABP3J2F2_9BACI
MTDDYSNNNHTDEASDPGRRRFIKNTGMIAGGVVGGSLLGGLLTNQFTDTEDDVKTESSKDKETNFQEARQFFTRMEDFAVLQAATERLFPENDDGPGAIKLGVPYYIDKQLAGLWGINGQDYRHAPFNPQAQIDIKNPEYQASQIPLNRGTVFLHGLRKLNEESQKQFNSTFDKADNDQQETILSKAEEGNITMSGMTSSNFFFLLRQATLEGAYCDPLYGGNRNMEGWKMKEFPGAQASYANVIDKDEFVTMEPVSLKSYQGD